MIVHETANHQMTVEFKLLLIPLRPSIMNQSPYHNGNRKRPRNTKCDMHKTRQSTNAKMVNIKQQMTRLTTTTTGLKVLAWDLYIIM